MNYYAVLFQGNLVSYHTLQADAERAGENMIITKNRNPNDVTISLLTKEQLDSTPRLVVPDGE